MRPNPDNAFLDLSICLNHFEDAPPSKRELIVWRLRQWGIERLLWSSDYLRINPTQQTPRASLETLGRYPFTQEEWSSFSVATPRRPGWKGNKPEQGTESPAAQVRRDPGRKHRKWGLLGDAAIKISRLQGSTLICTGSEPGKVLR